MTSHEEKMKVLVRAKEKAQELHIVILAELASLLDKSNPSSPEGQATLHVLIGMLIADSMAYFRICGKSEKEIRDFYRKFTDACWNDSARIKRDWDNDIAEKISSIMNDIRD